MATGDEQTRNEFLIAIGLANTAWGQLESSLAVMFSVVSGMDRTMARRVFYSATGFRSRIAMLKAAVGCPTIKFTSEAESVFIKEAIKRANQYTTVRNVLAHDCIVFFGFPGHDNSYQHVMVDGKYDRYLGEEDPLTLLQLGRFHRNVSHLVLLLQMFLQRPLDKTEELAQQYLLLLQQLPSLPRESELAQTDAEKLLSLLPSPMSFQL